VKKTDSITSSRAQHFCSPQKKKVPLVSPLKERLAARTSKSTTIPASRSEAIIHQVHSLSKIPFRTLAERNKRFV